MRLAGLTLLLLVASVEAAAEEKVIDAQTGLVIAPGWQDVRAHCGGCHSHALVTQQRADRDTWLAMIRWMQATQNLWQFQPETEQSILDYLSEQYPARRGQRRQPLAEDLLPP